MGPPAGPKPGRFGLIFAPAARAQANFSQIFDQIFAFICVYLLTSLNAKTRLYGFIVGTVGFIPGVYLLIVTKLWWLLAFMPIWAYINYVGIVNNYREYKKTKVA